MFSGADGDAQLANGEKMMSAEVKQRAGEANPYLEARRSWNEHVGSVVSSRQAWQVTGMLSLLVALASVGGMVYIGSQSNSCPMWSKWTSLDRLRPSGPRKPPNRPMNG
jgi:type IV secretion system protein TrbF